MSLTLRQLAGRILYHTVYAPLGVAQRLGRDGGPWVQRLTRKGEHEMVEAAARLPAPGGAQPGLPVHLLTGRRFWHQTAFCLYSLAHSSGRSVEPILYDDGTLDAEQAARLTALFPRAQVMSGAESLARLDQLLPRSTYPTLRDRWDHYPNIRKLIAPHLGSSGWKLVLDSDLLFFRSPEFLIRWLDAPGRPLHAVDTETSYGYSSALLERLAGAVLAPRLNVGLCGLRSDELDWDRLEHLTRTLIEAERTHYYLEQALVAVLLAGRPCAVAPEAEYLTFPRPPEALDCRAVMHHYVAGSKRWYFQYNWRRFTP